MSRPVVLNTRPREQAADLTSALEAAGLAVLEAPATSIQPNWNQDQVRAVAARLRAGTYDWLVLQSQNAARFLRQALPSVNLTTARVVCGASTAHALGLSHAETLDPFSAAAALAYLRSRIGPEHRVLVPRAAEGRPDLVEGLRNIGVLVDAPVVYATRPVPPARLPDLHGVSAIALCSPSAVHALQAAYEIDTLNRLALVCLGETTADAVRGAGLRVSAVAQHTSIASLVDAVRAALEVPA